MVIRPMTNTRGQYNGALLLREVLQEMVLPHPLNAHRKGARAVLRSKTHVKHHSGRVSTNIVKHVTINVTTYF